MKRTSQIEGTQRGYMVSIFEGSKMVACEVFHTNIAAMNKGGAAMHAAINESYAAAKRFEASAVSGRRPSYMKVA